MRREEGREERKGDVGREGAQEGGGKMGRRRERGWGWELGTGDGGMGGGNGDVS